MKKLIPLIILFTILAHNAFGQMLNIKSYSSIFLKNNMLDVKYELATIDHDYYDLIAALGGNELLLVDTPLEITLLSYSAGVIDIRPADADAILPANNPKLADTKLGAAVFQEIQVLRFLGDTAAVTRHESVLKFITDRRNVTRAEIETYYRNNIRSLITEIVSEEFNKIRFFISNTLGQGNQRYDQSYNGFLTRNPQNGQYTLSYEGYFNDDKQTKELTATSLEALSSTMRNSGDFSQDAINFVREQARLMPAVAASSKTRDDVVNTITAFYLNPNRNTYNELEYLFADLIRNDYAVSGSYIRALGQLNPTLAAWVMEGSI